MQHVQLHHKLSYRFPFSRKIIQRIKKKWTMTIRYRSQFRIATERMRLSIFLPNFFLFRLMRRCMSPIIVRQFVNKSVRSFSLKSYFFILRLFWMIIQAIQFIVSGERKKCKFHWKIKYPAYHSLLQCEIEIYIVSSSSIFS